jgi:hypothetical protein
VLAAAAVVVPDLLSSSSRKCSILPILIHPSLQACTAMYRNLPIVICGITALHQWSRRITVGAVPRNISELLQRSTLGWCGFYRSQGSKPRARCAYALISTYFKVPSSNVRVILTAVQAMAATSTRSKIAY